MQRSAMILRTLAIGVALYWAAALAALALFLPQAPGDPGFPTAPFTFLLVGAAAAPGRFAAPTPPPAWFLLLPALGVAFLAASVFVRRKGWALAALGFAAVGAGGAILFLTGYS